MARTSLMVAAVALVALTSSISIGPPKPIGRIGVTMAGVTMAGLPWLGLSRFGGPAIMATPDSVCRAGCYVTAYGTTACY